ncbi:MAG: sigma-70 family RNA polymerase sigma factor [Planctomycetota bacterium]
MNRSTEMGGPGEAFPPTRLSVIQAVRADAADVRQRALDLIVESYWKPVYKYLRLKWRLPNEEAKDLTQGFFTHALEKSTLDRFDPSKARFRTYLRTCLEGFAANEYKAANRLKRGGGHRHLSLDFEDADRELKQIEPTVEIDPDELFRSEWTRSLLGGAIDSLRERCAASGHETRFALFEAYDLEGPELETPPTYAELADRHGIAVTKVTNELHAARTWFREAVLDRLRQLTASDEEFRQEARDVLGLSL